MGKKIRLTTAQALIKFLNQQYIHVDGEETPFVEGIFTIFGHGNVVGIGQALEQDAGHLKVFQGKMSRNGACSNGLQQANAEKEDLCRVDISRTGSS